MTYMSRFVYLEEFNRRVDYQIEKFKKDGDQKQAAFWEHVKKTEVYFRATALFFFVLTIVVGALLYYYIIYNIINNIYANSVSNFINLLTPVILSIWAKVLFGIIILSIGCALFLFKKRQQLYYGLVETAFALTNCFLVANNFQSAFAQHNSLTYILISGMTTIYLIVRGLSNISEGWNKPFYLKTILSKDGFANFILSFGAKDE